MRATIGRLPMPTQASYEWQLRSACREVDPETFFSPEHERGARRRAREGAAKKLCGRCAVVSECLSHALEVRELYGVWGGLNTTERENLLRAAG